MTNSILNTIKEMLGITAECCDFDTIIKTDINSAMSTLYQLGVGPKYGFAITGAEELWHDLIGDAKALEIVKTYIYLKTKLLFDPPTSSAVIASIERMITEHESRIISYNESISVLDNL